MFASEKLVVAPNRRKKDGAMITPATTSCKSLAGKQLLLDFYPLRDLHAREAAGVQGLNFQRAEHSIVDAYVVDLAGEIKSGRAISMGTDDRFCALTGIEKSDRSRDRCDLRPI